eukprot:4138534-Amphidinium_carterae.2
MIYARTHTHNKPAPQHNATLFLIVVLNCGVQRLELIWLPLDWHTYTKVVSSANCSSNVAVR